MDEQDVKMLHENSMAFVGCCSIQFLQSRKDTNLMNRQPQKFVSYPRHFTTATKILNAQTVRVRMLKEFKTDQKALGVPFGELVTRYKTERTKHK